MQKLNTFTDTLLITSGSSSTHMSAISDRVIDDLKKNKIPIQSVQGTNSSDWIWVDLGNIVINIMSVSARQYYDLESLWDDSLAWWKDLPLRIAVSLEGY